MMLGILKGMNIKIHSVVEEINRIFQLMYIVCNSIAKSIIDIIIYTIRMDQSDCMITGSLFSLINLPGSLTNIQKNCSV